MTHPIVRLDSLQPRYSHRLGTSLVTVVTGHTSYDMLEKEVGRKLICLYLHVCYNTYFHNWKPLRHAEEYLGCLKAVGSAYNCPAVGCYFSLQPAGRCIVTIDRQTLNDSPAFLSLCLSFLSPFFSPLPSASISISLCVFQGLIMKFITVTDRRVTPV